MAIVPGKPGAAGTGDSKKDKANERREAFERASNLEKPEVQMQRCSELDEAVEALRVHFEQYFLGLLRVPPVRERDLLKKEVLRFKSSFIRDTAVKYRVNSLHNKFLSYERMWDRTLREMEEGTYRRDVFKAKLRAKGGTQAEELAEATATIEKVKRKIVEDWDVDIDEEETRAATSPPARPAASAPAARPAPAPAAARPAVAQAAAAAGGGASDAKLKAVYDAYLVAKRRCKESTDGLSFESVAATLRKQAGGGGADFKVVIKDGKATLKVVPK